jgi:hypothetical protein
MAELTPVQLQILLISGFLSMTWGLYLVGTVLEYLRIRNSLFRRRVDVVVAIRRFVVALCVWLFVFSFAFRIICVVFGVADETAAEIVFFTLLGSNVVGSIFAIASLWLD